MVLTAPPARATTSASSAVFIAHALNVKLENHTATLLNNGTVLITGGTDDTDTVQNTAEIFDPATGVTTTLSATMTVARTGHTATLLSDGRVLIAGGIDNTGSVLSSAELYNPSTGTFSAVGAMSSARAFHTATRLENGTVLVAGGVCGSTCNSGNSTSGVLFTADIFDPSLLTFTPSSSTMKSQRANYAATLLNDGTVLLTGGNTTSSSVSPTNSAEIYEPTRDNFFSVGRMVDSRSSHTATLLNDGTVLIAGGASGNRPMFATNALPSAEIYNPIARTFTQLAASMSDSRVSHSASLLQDGTVLLAGGMDDTLTPLSSADIYDPATQSFTPTAARMNVARSFHTATVLVDGTVLLAGGTTTGTDSGNTNEADLFDPTPGMFVPTGQMLEPRQFQTATMLQDGRVFVAGGQNAVLGALSSTEIYDGASYSAGPTLTVPRSFHTATSFVNGTANQILIAGGVTSAGGVTAAAEIYTEQVGGIGSIAATTTPMSTPRFGHTSTLLSNGDILIAGGENAAGVVLNSSDLFVPDGKGNGSFNITRVTVKGKTSSHNLVTARVYHTATTLCDGTVLIAGGRDPNGNYLSSAEIYNPATDSFASTGSGKSAGMLNARAFHTATLLTDCSVLIAGGVNSKGALNAAELYIPGVVTKGKAAPGKFVAVGPMNSARYLHTATMLSDGTVMIAGGESGSSTVLDSGEIYDPFLQDFTPAAGPMLSARYGQAAVALNSGFVLLNGGENSTFAVTASSELYDPPTGPHPGGAMVIPSPEAKHGRADRTVKAGAVWISNLSNLFETITDATLAVSDPSVFSSITMTLVDGRDRDRTEFKSPGAATQLVFDPPIELAPGAAVELQFKGRLAPRVRGQVSSQTITGLSITNSLGVAASSGLPAILGTVTEK